MQAFADILPCSDTQCHLPHSSPLDRGRTFRWSDRSGAPPRRKHRCGSARLSITQTWLHRLQPPPRWYEWWFNIISPPKVYATARPEGRYRKQYYRLYYKAMLPETSLPDSSACSLYISVRFPLLYCRLSLHSILLPRMLYSTYFVALNVCHKFFFLNRFPL